jgi:hypothetical protein
MDSFSRYAERAKKYAAQAVQSIADPDAQRWALFAIVIPAALFVILSPGLLLNLPNNSKARCAKLVPFPSDATGSCNGKAYTVGTSDGVTAPQMAKICEARNECSSYWMSGYTSAGPIFLHAVVFVLLAYLINMLLRRAGVSAPRM